MMTERLYFADSYLTEFEARVLEVRPAGHHHEVVLDRTAFYPASGGQPFDTGVLGEGRVVDVRDPDDGRILHVIDGEPPAGRVLGRVDWGRRFEHMQQHTGQHVLSAAFDRRLRVRTESFHLGSTASTIDLAREVTPAEIAQAEETANQVVWEDRPVTIRVVEAEAAAALPLRKEPARTGPLRIVEIDGVDVSACGGTHVRRTGGIGIIVVTSWERFRGGTRLDFLCGVRALRSYRLQRDALAASIQLVSVAPEEIPIAIGRLQSENRDSKRHAKALEARLAACEAEALVARAVEAGGMRVVFGAVPAPDVPGLKAIAQRIAARPDHVAVVCTSSDPVAVVIARGADAPLDAAAVLRHLLGQFGGKGGGRPELAQGGGLNAPPERILQTARSLILD